MPRRSRRPSAPCPSSTQYSEDGRSPWRGPAAHLLAALTALSLGCGASALNPVGREVFVSPDGLDFGDVYVGSLADLPLQVTNVSRGSQVLQLATPPPFEAPAELAMQGGSSAEVRVAFLLTVAGAFTGELVLGGRAFALRGNGLEVPECTEPLNACITAAFDPRDGRCVETQRPEGSACASRCVPSGVCSLGECAGEFASCDDGDACSDDACSAAQGCMHTLKACPASPANPCRVGACDPAQGCLFVDARDGVLCGPKNCRTNTVPVCIAAQCVDRPLPTPECFNQFGYLKPSTTRGGDSFGNRVAISADGNKLVVGASVESTSAVRSGAVFVFHRTGNTWAEEASLKASNPGAGDSFGYAVALSADGDTLVVGAHLEDGQDEAVRDSGAAYVFVRRNGSWTEERALKASHAAPGDAFGSSVAISGDGARLVVGAPGAGGAGAVSLFRRIGGRWLEDAPLASTNLEAGDLFGFSVALSTDGSTLAVGALGEDSQATGVNGNETGNAAPQSGAVYVFRISPAATAQVAYVKASNTGAADVFGFSVALSSDGSVLAVGAWGEDSSATGIDGDQAGNAASQSGAVYVFRRQGGVFTQEAFVKASNTQLGDDFGYGVALSGDGRALAVGAWSEDSGSTGIDGHQLNASQADSGALFLFRQAGGAWAQDVYVKASNTEAGDFFGSSVALSADASALVSSAPGEDSNATGINGNQLDNSAPESGAVYVFSLQ